MSSENNKGKGKISIFGNLIWKFAERCGAQGVSFLVTIVLARMIEPSDYGLIAMVTVVIAVFNVFVDSGMGNALVQKKDVDDVDFSSVFYFNIVFCLIFYIMLFIVSPFIANVYGEPELTLLIRVLGVTILLSGIKNIQIAYISRNMQFKKYFISTMGATIISAFIGIAMAYKGFGIWALVSQYITNATVGTIILWMTVKWKPRFIFSFHSLKKLISYGWKILISNLLDTVYNNMQQIIIGAVYSSTDVAFYNKGKSFPLLVVDNLNSSINSVIFPTMSSVQDNKETLFSMLRRSIKTSMYVVIPLMFGMIAISKPFVSVVLTDKWLESVPYLRIFSLALMFYPWHSANLNTILAIGRSDLYLKLETIKKIIGILLLIGSTWFGPLTMAYAFLAFNMVSIIINTIPNKKYLDYGLKKQIGDILPIFGLSFIMMCVVLLIGIIRIPIILRLLVQIILGIFIYLEGSKLLRLDSFGYLLDVINKIFKKV